MLPFCPLLSWLPASSSNGNPAPICGGDPVAPGLLGSDGAVGEVAERQMRSGSAAATASAAPPPSSKSQQNHRPP